MLLRHRPPGIDAQPAALRAGLEHLEQRSIAVLRWLNVNKVDFVVVGPVAHAIRGDLDAKGPVAIVPAPYGRNFERLASALVAEHAGLRSDRTATTGSERGGPVAVRLNADKIARGRRWMLRFGIYDLDVEGSGTRAAGARGAHPGAAGAPASAPRYQELLYEAGRFELADGVSVEVASPEDLEHFSHVRRTGTAPEFRVIRNPQSPSGTDSASQSESDPEPAPGSESPSA
jgi:hypothetical protein